MSEVNDTEKLLIEVPEYLSLDDESGISTLADCGSCQSTTQSCGSDEYGDCSACEGLGTMSCSESCSESCSSCETSACESPQECAGGQCGDSQGGCGGCEDGCQDCQSSCQNTVQSSVSISLWSWTSSNGDATDDQTKAAYSAVANKGLTSKFSYLVWNDLVNKVQEVLDASDDTWNSKYCTKANALMSSSDKTLTATRFNSVRYNIGLRYSTGISEVAKGDSVLGSYFTTMTTSLNAWINNVAT